MSIQIESGEYYRQEHEFKKIKSERNGLKIDLDYVDYVLSTCEGLEKFPNRIAKIYHMIAIFRVYQKLEGVEG